MATICFQQAHYDRTRGSTGTIREQEYTVACIDIAKGTLEARGHTVLVVKADPVGRVYPEADATIAPHLDGGPVSATGFSSFHPIHSGYNVELSHKLALAWSSRHKDHYPGNNRGINYLGSRVRDTFYGWREDRFPSDTYRSPAALLTESLFATNARDYDWLWNQGGVELCAAAHADAVSDIFGDPLTEPDPTGTDRMVYIFATNPANGSNTAQHVWDGKHRWPVNQADKIALEFVGLIDDTNVYKVGWETFTRIPERP